MNNFLKIMTGALLCAGLAVIPMNTNATTIDDLSGKARSMGFPEEMIQAGYNKYYESPELYPPEVIDSYMVMLDDMTDEMIQELVAESGFTMGGDKIPVVTSYVPSNPSEPETPAEPSQTVTAVPEVPVNINSQPIEYTMPDGSTFTRVSVDDFAAMTLEQKKAYIASFTSEQQTVILQNLSPEEYKSLLKQLPVDDKIDIVNQATAITDGMGMSLTIDELTDDNLTMSMRDENGKLVAVGSVKDKVADTGYDRRGILALAAALVLIGLSGTVVIAKKCFSQGS
ncbi:MAG: hypothetical protein K2I00_08395 [Ruminococcus sp.]|nr:hypothetical protein [Ruminococcus sp.]